MPKPIPVYSIPFTKKELSIITHALDLQLQEMENYDDLTEDPLTKGRYKTLTKLYTWLLGKQFKAPNVQP
jgi:hypothetical protein